MSNPLKVILDNLPIWGRADLRDIDQISWDIPNDLIGAVMSILKNRFEIKIEL